VLIVIVVVVVVIVVVVALFVCYNGRSCKEYLPLLICRDGGKASLPPPLPLLERRSRFPDDPGRQDNRRRRIAYLYAEQYDIGTRFFSRYGRRRAVIVDGFVSSFLIDVQPNSAPGLTLVNPSSSLPKNKDKIN